MAEPRRTWKVTVQEWCDVCNSLQANVQVRKWVDPHWASTNRFELKSCQCCFDKKVSEQTKHEDDYLGFY